MRGSDTRRSPLKHLAAVTVVIALAGTFAPPAHAHRKSNFRKERAHLKDRARSQIGARYSYGGSSPRGYDCSGLTNWVFDGHGDNLPRTSMEQFQMAKRDGYKRVWKRKKLEAGDLVFHKTTSARVGHVGIYIGGGKFISSTSSSGVRVRSVWDPYYWGRRWVGATRVPATIRYK